MPAPKRNKNNLRHGLRSFASGSLPNGASYIATIVATMRRQIVAAIVAVRGELTIDETATLQTACRWETHSMLAQRWLKLRADEMSPELLLKFSREICVASERRDVALRLLRLDPANLPDSRK